MGGSTKDIARAMAISYVSGMAFNQAHGMPNQTFGQQAARVAAHGTIGGGVSAAQGGKFAHGFVGAAFSQTVSLSGFYDNFSGNRFAQAMVAGVVGGGASVASGGKFESGATAAVFGHLFNDMANDLSNLSGDLSYLRHIPEGYEPGNYPTGQCIIAGYGTAWLEVMSFFGGNAVGSVAFKFATRGSDFFKGATYTNKIKQQMQLDDFHSFPRSVEGFQGAGKVTRFRNGDGTMVKKLEIPGGYKGREGNFEFIKAPDGKINHRYFRPDGQ